MPFDLFKEIEDDFRREKYEINNITNLDEWVSFYFKHGRWKFRFNNFTTNSTTKIS